MELEDIVKELHKESETKVPDVYNKVVSQAKAEGLLDRPAQTEIIENRNNGGAISLSMRIRMGVAGLLCFLLIAIFTTVMLFATVFNGLIAPPISEDPPVVDPDEDNDDPDVPVNPDKPIPAGKPIGESYAVGLLSTAKLIDAFTTTETRARGGTSSGMSQSGNFFSNYFNAFGTFFGDDVVTVADNPVSSDKYSNKLTISGTYANGDKADDYYLYYIEAKNEDESAADGSVVKYYLDGGLRVGKHDMVVIGERTFTQNASVENELSVRAYPDFKNKNTYALMQIEYSSDPAQPATKYNYEVVIGGKTISEAVAYQPVADSSGATVSYVFEIKGEAGSQIGTYSVYKPDASGNVTVDFSASGEEGQYIVKQSGSKYQPVLAGGFIYTVDGNECTVIGYNKNKTLPQDLVIPNAYKGKNVVAIGDSAFKENSDIKSVTIPQGVKTIGKYAFYGCDIETVNLPAGLETIGNYTFGYCKSIKNITLPDSIKNIGANAFENCVLLIKVALPESLETIEEEVFSGCIALTSVSVHKGVTKIDSTAFSSCTQLVDLTVDQANSVYYSQTNCVIERATGIVAAGCSSSVIPNDGSITAIGDYAFYRRTGLKYITIPNSVKSIGREAFTQTALENVVIPEGVVTLSVSAFERCASLISVSLPSTLKTIGGGAFSRCGALIAINIPANVDDIGHGAFNYCTELSSITVSAANAKYHAIGNCLIERAEKTLIAGCYNSVIPSDGPVINISSYAFSGIGKSQTITVPQCITSLGNGAFAGCAFSEVVLHDKLTEIGDNAFYMSEIQKVIIPDSVTTLGTNIFSWCFSLTEVKLSANVTIIPNGTFENCPIQEIEIPEKVFDIGSRAFAGTRLQNVELPETIKVIGFEAFAQCSALRIVRLYKVTQTGEDNPEFRDETVYLRDRVFVECGNLVSVQLPEKINSVPAQLFYGCTNLKQVVYDGTVAQWQALNKGSGIYFGCEYTVTVQCSDSYIFENVKDTTD